LKGLHYFLFENNWVLCYQSDQIKWSREGKIGQYKEVYIGLEEIGDKQRRV